MDQFDQIFDSYSKSISFRNLAIFSWLATNFSLDGHMIDTKKGESDFNFDVSVFQLE